MTSETLNQIAEGMRWKAAQGRYHGKASALVKEFGLEFTADSIREVENALAQQGLASQPPLSPTKPKAHVRVLIVGGSPSNAGVQVEDIEIFVGEPGCGYRTLGRVISTVTGVAIFSKAPTIEDANLKLREHAGRMGANAVINVAYRRGISATAWKELTATGTAVVVDRQAGTTSAGADMRTTDPVERIRQLADLAATGAITEEEYAAAKAKLLGEL